jgi:ATP-binding cassette subfamily A (ABC1) protein 3
MLTGLFTPTSGDAIIFGSSIIDGMEDIRRVMGVCPQHDILWDQLTGREHLEMFAAFKGMKKNEIGAEVHERLKVSLL